MDRALLMENVENELAKPKGEKTRKVITKHLSYKLGVLNCTDLPAL